MERLSLDVMFREHPVLWFLGTVVIAFGGGFSSYAAIERAAGVEHVKTGAYEPLANIQSNYISRDEVETKYLPLSAVEQDFVPREQVAHQFISRSECARGIEEARAQVCSGQGSGTTASPSSFAPSSRIDQDGFSFSLPSCGAGGGRVICDFAITNRDQRRRTISLYYNYGEQMRSYISDSSGNQFFGVSVALGGLRADASNSWASTPTQELEPDIPMKAAAGFDSGLKPGSTVAMVLVYLNENNRASKVTFKNIVLGSR